ncbi:MULTISPECIES: hypothetical protein [Levilactobacillus]|uniref:hypothetical protein n=1 Tax=Levilactobacillus TaxID=2767886 RepID=UPI001950B96C|nr:hypothetical protein [Levilactobacillus sp. 244-2]
MAETDQRIKAILATLDKLESQVRVLERVVLEQATRGAEMDVLQGLLVKVMATNESISKLSRQLKDLSKGMEV